MPVDLLLVPLSVVACAVGAWWLHRVDGAGSRGLLVVGVLWALHAAHLLVGRFAVKRWTKERTRYAVTDRWALILTSGSGVSDVDLRATPVRARYDRGHRHMTAVIGRESDSLRAAMTANTGLDPFGMRSGHQFALYDVSDVGGLTRALDTACRGPA